MLLPFAKMQALGNDFVVLDGTRPLPELSPDFCRRLADRRRGIGCDQILVVDPPPDAQADFGYRIYNADGSQVGQCGNGARCLARFVERRGLSQSRSIRVATRSTRMQLDLLDDGWVRAILEAPDFAPAQVPIRRERAEDLYTLASPVGEIRGGAVSVGNPHFVIPVADVASAPVAEWGALLATHPDFPEGVNVGFVEQRDAGHLRLRVYERGVGETPACGSGACAAAVLMRHWRKTDTRVMIELPGGSLRVQWDENQNILMEGPADWVYEGEIET